MLTTRETSEPGTSKKRVMTNDRTQCPICLLDVAELPGRTTLTKHLASHLERFSLDCLPLNTISWVNENLHDYESESSDPDQDLPFEHHEHNAHNGNEQQETIIEGFEAQTKEDYRVEKVVLSEEAMRDIELGQLLTPVESELLGAGYKHIERRTQEEPENEETSSSREMIWERIYVERKQVLEDDQRRRRQAEDNIGIYEAGSSGKQESYNSGSEHDLRDKIDAKKKLIIEDSERRQRELKEEQDYTMSELVDDAQHMMNDSMRKRLAETGFFTQAQIDAIMADKKNQQPASIPPETAPRPAGGRTGFRTLVYSKIHTDYIIPEALKYYDIPWEYDKVIKTRMTVLRLD